MTQEQIDVLVERLVQRTNQANIFYLKKIGSAVKQLKELTPSQAHQLAQILKYGGSYEDILQQLSKYTNLDIQDIDKIFYEYAKKDYSFYEKFYQYRNIPYIPYNENEALIRQTEALIRTMKTEMYDYFRTNVLGYTIRNVYGKPVFYGLKETYNRVIDEVLLNVGQGKESIDSAIRNILKDIGSSGLKTIDYKSGRSVRLDSTLRTHLNSKLLELHNENQKIIGEEIDSDGVEITVHTNPAPDHAPVQGLQFSNEEFEKLQNGELAQEYNSKNKYTLDHDDKNGYRPISEMNCYHAIFSIVLGVDKPLHTKKELKQILEDNNKGFDFDNKHYNTKYEGLQLQRSIEREIRKQKDIQILAKSSGDMDLVYKAQGKITKLTRKYKDLSDISGLPTKVERLYVNGYKKIKTNIKETTKIYEDLTNQLKKMQGNTIASEKRLNYALTLDGIRYPGYYFEPNNKLTEEIKYQSLIEQKTGYSVYLNPKAKEQKIRTADFWIKDIDELWDLKGIDGNKPKTIDTIFKNAKGQTENLILKQRKTDFSTEEIKEKIDIIFENNWRKHIKQVVLVDKEDNIVLYYKR